ncbi:endonuclease domain-containing protein [Krasilnikovia sp. MM14-A1259]|uniref:endonuclease domain-containing protein n=1 Tax=Krasilnikovia sp. MM14-A1259 TaxID=3373539 RepID=UPI003816B3C9
MSRPGLSTTQRGYGIGHKRARLAALEHLRHHDGQPCHHCGKPMWHAYAARLDLDHTDDRTGYRGLAHASCNRRAGQAKGMRARTVVTRQRSRNW